ncbi:histidine phosphatase family protein [Bifidobacterium sp.]|jgi:2,3-bisphosphoglycerate-dependent phosphoglycerate mutase|uniref:histidine phosphatase family protein n=1 Tax=Bifidobacterium sp. TaxID=41200 RepID=UPI0025C54C01|nr:histidine phosphatase family protein [Bifidobacterium sp.]MCH4209838.1 histidine phosphatase family protein [Bifidobacterium sp.]MCI1224159.1 histidine phosphatase family protein [Bifidobacterium sp.]
MIDEVVFLRHGRTSYNLARRMQGQIDVPLDIIGQWQVDQSALELASAYYWAKVSQLARNPERLAQPGPEAVKHSEIEEYREAPAAGRTMRVVASDLFRAQQTAHAFADILGLPVTCDTRLRERSFGRWEGLTRAEIMQMDAKAYEEWKTNYSGGQRYGVESLETLGRRGADAVNGLISREGGRQTPGTLVIVGHGSWIIATIHTLLGEDPETSRSLDSVRNAFWSRMMPQYSIPGHRGGQAAPVSWKLEEFNHGPAIASRMDWENGPAELRGPHMKLWQVL